MAHFLFKKADICQSSFVTHPACHMSASCMSYECDECVITHTLNLTDPATQGRSGGRESVTTVTEVT